MFVQLLASATLYIYNRYNVFYSVLLPLLCTQNE
jgi:hypothetical protein